MGKVFTGIDLGGTYVKIGIFEKDLKLIAKTSIPTNACMGPENVVEEITKSTQNLLRDKGLSLKDVCSVGIGTPGPAKYSQGIIINAANLPKFVNTPIRDMVSDKFGCHVVLENDANAACWGEYTIGAGSGVKDMVFFTLGTGIGGGIISNGQLVRGFGENAAELGHTIIYPDGRKCGCGQTGCVEAYASAASTARRAMETVEVSVNSSLKKILAEKGTLTSKDVYEHAPADTVAMEITEGTAKALGLLCVNMMHITGPQKIVFSGGMIAAGQILLDRIKFYFNHYLWRLKTEEVEICFATLGEDAGIIGSAALGRDAYNP